MAGDSSELFICSYCEQQIKITKAHIGRRIKCPKCTRTVFVYPNHNQHIESFLTSQWYYNRPRLLFGSEKIGPILDEQFLDLVRAGEVDHDFEVSSPEFTKSGTLILAQINLSVVQEQIDQRNAETQRKLRREQRKQAIAVENRQRLTRAIVAAVSDGHVTLHEREQLLKFAHAARIPESEVEAILSAEAKRLCDALVEECLSDGILEPAEKQSISDLAVGLGLTLAFTPEQLRRLQICELAFELANGTFSPGALSLPDISLIANETPVAIVRAEWCDVVKQKNPVGIALGDGHFLKQVGDGDCVLTNKRVLFIDKFNAKKFTLSSVALVRRFDDGVFCQRSTGKSVFLKLAKNRPESDRFAMLVEFAASKHPVLGSIPTESFVPQSSFTYPDADGFVSEVSEPDFMGSQLSPRYTFRVVGDHVGDRAYWIETVGVGDSLNLIREPTNPHDDNAVLVSDTMRHQLGYLKRQVASWFGPMLDRGYECRCHAYRKPSSGGLIVGVFEG